MYYTKEETPLLAKNAPLENATKNLGSPLPLIWTKSKRTAVFSQETFPPAFEPESFTNGLPSYYAGWQGT